MPDAVNTTSALLVKTTELEDDLKGEIAELKNHCDRLFKAASKVSESSSGSSLGYHSELYYGDFEKPPLESRFSPEWGGRRGLPDGWQARDHDDVKERIETLADSSFDKIERPTEGMVNRAKELQTDIEIELSALHDLTGYERELELLTKVVEHKWGHRVGEYIKAYLPGPSMTRDTNALSQGSCVPAYLYYEAVADTCRSRCIAAEEFFKLSHRLLRQVQRRGAQLTRAIGNTRSSSADLVKLVCERFHLIARQLLDRREDRPTLEVTDEYDVQDLLHALLRVHFDDVRSEEWTPSYAGRSSRMDFLLKADEIVVETKMTREGLDAGKVGDQLTVDAAHYKGHADCKTLICFVYDPHNRIKNPRGVESDLDQLSVPDVKVIAIIAP